MIFSFIKKIIYIICLVLFYSLCGSPYMTIFPEVRNLVYLGIILLLPVCYSRYKNKCDFYTEIGLVLFTVICIIIGFSKGESLGLYISIASIFIFSYLFAKCNSLNGFIQLYGNCITVISAIDLIFYVILQFIGNFNFFPEFINSNGTIYKIGIIFNYIKFVPIRNCAVFWEPGIYASVIIIALLFEYTYINKISKIRVLLFHVCLFTTFSSAGIILLMICDLIYLFKFMNSNLKNKCLVYIIFSVLFIFLIFAFVNFDRILIYLGLDQHQFYNKLMSSNFENSSRINAIKHNLDLFVKNPLFGVGIGNAYASTKLFEDTSSTTFMMAELGLLGLIPTVVLLFSILKQKIFIIEKWIMSVVFLCILNKEPHMGIVLVWTIMFIYIQNKEEKLIVIPKGSDEINGKQR